MYQYGSFGGLDTCYHVEFGNFEIRYILIFDNEDKSIADRYNVNPHLNLLCKHKIISNETVDSMHNKAQKSKYENVIDNS